MRRLVSPVGLFAVGVSSAQLTWGNLPAGQVRLQTEHDEFTVDHGGGPGSREVDGLTPGADFTITVTPARGQSHSVSGTTLQPPSGELLTRFATISDLHLGARRWGFFKTMTEAEDRYEVPYPVRAAVAAIEEAVAWGAELLVIKGDAANHEEAYDFELLGQLVDRFPDLHMLLIPGNHDVDGGGNVIPETVGARQLPFIAGVGHADVPGARLVVANSTKPGQGSGTLAAVAEQIIDVVADAPSPVFLGLHHQLQPTKIPRYWPKGIPAPESTEFLERLAAITPNVLISSGHTHRNRARRHGPIGLTEVASTKDWPGVWGAYTVYEGGITQSVRRIGEPSVMEWTEYSQQAVAGLWSKWAPGQIHDRCLSHVWARDSLLVA